jgi:spermidine synthase
MRFEAVRASGKTLFQEYAFVETREYGRALILDGRLQSTAADEHIYHESLVHPAMAAHPDPRRIFIGGGGEGATLREVLRHRSVTGVRMADIDREVVDLCRAHLTSFHEGAFDDPRVELQHRDARLAVLDGGLWDVVISDITEPLAGSAAVPLFSRECFAEIHSSLVPDGVFVLQAGSTRLGAFSVFASVVRTLRAVFPAVYPCQVIVPSFFEPWGFIVALKKAGYVLPDREFEKKIRSRLSGPLRWLNQETYEAAFAMDPLRRKDLEAPGPLITDSEPLALSFEQ